MGINSKVQIEVLDSVEKVSFGNIRNDAQEAIIDLIVSTIENKMKGDGPKKKGDWDSCEGRVL